MRESGPNSLARIELSDAAEADLEEISAHSFERYSPAVALDYLESFRQAFALLARYPDIGALHADMKKPIHSLPNRSHRIYYDIDGDRVIVQRILHKAMDAEKWLE